MGAFLAAMAGHVDTGSDSGADSKMTPHARSTNWMEADVSVGSAGAVTT